MRKHIHSTAVHFGIRKEWQRTVSSFRKTSHDPSVRQSESSIAAENSLATRSRRRRRRARTPTNELRRQLNPTLPFKSKTSPPGFPSSVRTTGRPNRSVRRKPKGSWIESRRTEPPDGAAPESSAVRPRGQRDKIAAVYGRYTI